jgi:hypothetical protein
MEAQRYGGGCGTMLSSEEPAVFVGAGQSGHVAEVADLIAGFCDPVAPSEGKK